MRFAAIYRCVGLPDDGQPSCVLVVLTGVPGVGTLVPFAVAPSLPALASGPSEGERSTEDVEGGAGLSAGGGVLGTTGGV